ncbi:FecR family protein [Abyssalbus ytuae]|uniref:FecR family protein n=1 Tax=Abyssalbus ytuae TaxID=2926907 RepID=A0A9E6ZM95_9FLAO|nr:FecR family protein [Abyssalbus ytuae]UOB17269.1 FecR family protein [Abyssalbus ytuae]
MYDLEKYWKKHLEGTATEAEVKILLELLEDPENKLRVDRWLREKWDHALSHKPNNFKSQKAVWNKIKGVTTHKKVNPYKFSAAAVIILLIGLVFLYQKFPRYITLKVNAGEVATMYILPDSSKIWINSSSTVKYKKDFIANRKVELKGEAYFEVHKNTKSPFTIHFLDNTLKVTGTKFNIDAYSNDINTTVTIKEGSVEVYNQIADTTSLRKNNQLIISNLLKKQSKKHIHDFDFDKWKDGKIIFNKTPLSEALKILERRFDITFTTNEVDLKKDVPITARYHPGITLEEILNGLTIITNFKYEKTKDAIKINSKEK